jgi:hypothetical protein
MKFYLTMLIFMILFATVSAGCNQNNVNADGQTLKQIKSFYPEDIHDADRIEILSSAGERKKIENKEVIEQWLDLIGEIKVTVDPHRDDHSGSLFAVTIFESQQEKFRLTPTSINRVKIMPNDEVIDHISQLWDGGNN